jgi:hypothetical protein
LRLSIRPPPVSMCFIIMQFVLMAWITFWTHSTETWLPLNELLMVFVPRCFCFSCYETKTKQQLIMAKQHLESVITTSRVTDSIPRTSVCVCWVE